MSNKNDLTKITMNLSHRSMANVEELSEMLDETNRTRVIASSLEVTKHLIAEVKKGNRLFFEDNKGNKSELKMII